ncbi:23S rRNA (cytidine(2498)-2'-O)-methyltransferase RlmM [Metallibacterium sp.]|uniref:23S rRNA (cytidine(2498)-2'-O)-methyltransferase RlmM n=1 Tax=Metallibacterium sp. TaxID=2940281 RepID=UPI0026288A23|nr:23S rRNA (cytidine(2498)-2'-O)-methyltransferase RlmM [Metallibacterium sp.]
MTPADSDNAYSTPVSGRVVLCRAGFEGEAAGELATAAAAAGLSGFARAGVDSGVASFELHDAATLDALEAATPWPQLIFARTAWSLHARLQALPASDRVTPLLRATQAQGRYYAQVLIEHADSDGGRELATLARALAAPLRGALQRAGLLHARAPRDLHVLLNAGDAALLCSAAHGAASPWPGGIPRLRFPSAAPSRSTLKLEEALLVLLDERERERWLRPGMRAVDLGAAPGGWTYQLVRRSIHVSAVDNGPMQPALLESGLVEHLRSDGFRWRPGKPVDWLVCDMVEQPRRVAALMAAWLRDGACRRALFNLKLPMKKRREEVQLCLGLLRAAVPGIDLRARQLHHDREEITVLALPPSPR